jgi:DNA-binding CsgD family transcriptional regulator
LGGLVALGNRDHERVKALCEEGFHLARQVGNTRVTALIAHVLAASAGSQRLPICSARLWGAAESTLDALGIGLGPAERYHYGPYLAAARAQLDEVAWEEAWAEGKAMPLEAAFKQALSGEEPTPAPASREPSSGKRTTVITPREREVALLVAQGLTNRQVATELVLSEHTVAKHISKILKKLGLRSRAQIAAWVVE